MATIKGRKAKAKEAKRKKAVEEKELSRTDINKAIAKLLGYKSHSWGENVVGDKLLKWTVPEKYRFTVRSYPCTSVPDFVSMIEFVMFLEKTYFRFGFPRDNNAGFRDHNEVHRYNNSFKDILIKGISPKEC